jgi:pyruvate dehydrogenase E2 component (dihydrolipoamide acetyltransferase)
VHATGTGGRVHRDDVERAAAGRTAPTTPSRRARRVTPRARRLLAANGLSPDGFDADALVTGDIVLAALVALAARTGAPEVATAGPMPAEGVSRATTMRRHIGELMARSWAEIPHYHVSSRLDLGAMSDALMRHNDTRPLDERVVPGAALLCAAARAAASVPSCNGWWRDGAFVGADAVRLGVVLSLRSGGIIVPTVVDADALSIDEMMRRLTELVQRARLGRLRASDMAEATITVTSLGDRGAESVVGVIHPPQVALVGIGAVRDDLWVRAGAPEVRSTATVTLSGDHRAIDGLTGSRFLTRMQTALDHIIEEDPS